MRSARHRYIGNVTVKEQLRSLVDGLDDHQAAEVIELIRERYPREAAKRRRLPFVATLHAEPDFAERSEEILRNELGRSA